MTIYFSPWKVIGIEIALLAMAVLPLTPGFGEGLVYTSALYDPALFPILLISCGFIGFIFLCLLPLLWRAIFNLPAMEIFDEYIRVYGLNGRSIPKSKIQGVEGPVMGNLTIKLDEGRSASVPVFLYRNSSDALRTIGDSLRTTR